MVAWVAVLIKMVVSLVALVLVLSSTYYGGGIGGFYIGVHNWDRWAVYTFLCLVIAVHCPVGGVRFFILFGGGGRLKCSFKDR